MKKELVKILSEEDVVRYIAYRHGIDTARLVRDFLAGKPQNKLGLLDNEMMIIRDIAKRLMI